MKRKLSLFVMALLLVAEMIMGLSLAGCQNRNTQQEHTRTMPRNQTEKTMADTVSNIVTQNLTVKTMADTAEFTGVPISPDCVTGYDLGVEVDYPVDGPQPLTDSVRNFVTKELYSMFEFVNFEEESLFPFEKVCGWKSDNIVTDFLNNYRPFYEKEILGVGGDYMSLRLVDQTETFVTYFGEYNSCGASCSTGYCYYTFRKRDGLLLIEITSNEKLKAFVKEHPGYKILLSINYYEKKPYEQVQISDYFGMLKNGVVFVDPMGLELGELWETIIPYSEIKPYLSKEAQALIPSD